MVIVKVRYRNIVSNFVYFGDDEIDALSKSIPQFRSLFGRVDYKLIGTEVVKNNPFPKFRNIGIRALLKFNR